MPSENTNKSAIGAAFLATSTAVPSSGSFHSSIAGGSVPSCVGVGFGDHLAGYRLTRGLGEGGFASVFEATTPLGACVALKVLHTDLAADLAHVTRFRREPYLMSAVRHPDIPRVHEAGTTPGGVPWFAMDLIPGETLADRADRFGGRLSVRDVERIGLQLAAILSAVHAAGVLHLDVKPENVFATPDGRVVLSDFGIARWRSEDERTSAGGDANDDAMGGTPMFMAPEQLAGTGLGPWTDVRALGATLFVLLTGRTVGSTVASRTLLGLLLAPPRPLASVLPSAPAYLARLIDRCLSPQPYARPTVKEVVETLLFAHLRARCR